MATIGLKKKIVQLPEFIYFLTSSEPVICLEYFVDFLNKVKFSFSTRGVLILDYFVCAVNEWPQMGGKGPLGQGRLYPTASFCKQVWMETGQQSGAGTVQCQAERGAKV